MKDVRIAARRRPLAAAPAGFAGVRQAQSEVPTSAPGAIDGQVRSALAADEIIAGLTAEPARISPKYFYDDAGSALFERITRLPEYYPTRTEAEIMTKRGAEIAGRIASEATVIELGAGNCEKAKTLCALIRPKCFVAVDIAGDYLADAVAGLRKAFPTLAIETVVADINRELTLPATVPLRRRLVFYPGSSIGNFDAEQAMALLVRMRRLLADEGALLIGVDLIKDPAILEAAYNDTAGVTAAFNRNVLVHLNRLIGSDFDVREWRHLAFFNRQHSRIEMHLEACVETRVSWPGGERRFRCGERIHTENSYKYRADDFSRLLEQAGFARPDRWTDARHWFCVFHAEVGA